MRLDLPVVPAAAASAARPEVQVDLVAPGRLADPGALVATVAPAAQVLQVPGAVPAEAAAALEAEVEAATAVHRHRITLSRCHPPLHRHTPHLQTVTIAIRAIAGSAAGIAEVADAAVATISPGIGRADAVKAFVGSSRPGCVQPGRG